MRFGRRDQARWLSRSVCGHVGDAAVGGKFVGKSGVLDGEPPDVLFVEFRAQGGAAVRGRGVR